MTDIPSQIQHNLLDHTIDLHRVEAGLRRKIQQMLDQLARDLAAEIMASGIDTPRAAWQEARLKDLMKAAERDISAVYGKIDAATSEKLAELAQITADGAIQAVNDALGVELLQPVRWSPEYLVRLADRTLIEGAPSAEWWGRQAAGFRDDFLDQMRQGLLRGESITDLRDRIVPKRDLRLRENAGEASAIRKARRGAEALVRTSAISVANQAHMDAYQANADILAGVTWLATLDMRSCPRCAALDGKEWTMTEAHPSPALHWNCRCMLLPRTKTWEELAKDAHGNSKVARALDQMPPGTRASMGGQVDGNLTYEGWFDSLSQDRQMEILGPGKYELWKKGNLGFTDMLDQRGNVLTLDELRKKVGG